MASSTILEQHDAIYGPGHGPPIYPHNQVATGLAAGPVALERRRKKHQEAKKKRQLQERRKRLLTNGGTLVTATTIIASSTNNAINKSSSIPPPPPAAAAAVAGSCSNLPATDLPAGFPPELAFRALAAYSLIRTLSRELRLSPFTPNAFLRSLYLPIPNRLLGQVHVALLRVLLPGLHMGYHWGSRGRSSSSSSSSNSNHHAVPPVFCSKKRKVDGLRWPLRGGDNLEFLDYFSWPLFYDDYAHLTADILYANWNSAASASASASAASHHDTSNDDKDKDEDGYDSSSEHHHRVPVLLDSPYIDFRSLDIAGVESDLLEEERLELERQRPKRKLITKIGSTRRNNGSSSRPSPPTVAESSRPSTIYLDGSEEEEDNDDQSTDEEEFELDAEDDDNDDEEFRLSTARQPRKKRQRRGETKFSTKTTAMPIPMPTSASAPPPHPQPIMNSMTLGGRNNGQYYVTSSMPPVGMSKNAQHLMSTASSLAMGDWQRLHMAQQQQEQQQQMAAHAAAMARQQHRQQSAALQAEAAAVLLAHQQKLAARKSSQTASTTAGGAAAVLLAQQQQQQRQQQAQQQAARASAAALFLAHRQQQQQQQQQQAMSSAAPNRPLQSSAGGGANHSTAPYMLQPQQQQQQQQQANRQQTSIFQQPHSGISSIVRNAVAPNGAPQQGTVAPSSTNHLLSPLPGLVDQHRQQQQQQQQQPRCSQASTRPLNSCTTTTIAKQTSLDPTLTPDAQSVAGASSLGRKTDSKGAITSNPRNAEQVAMTTTSVIVSAQAAKLKHVNQIPSSVASTANHVKKESDLHAVKSDSHAESKSTTTAVDEKPLDPKEQKLLEAKKSLELFLWGKEKQQMGQKAGSSDQEPANNGKGCSTKSLQRDAPRSTDDIWTHFRALEVMRAGTPYHRLSVEKKLDVLEFLLDDLLSVDAYTDIMTRRRSMVPPTAECPYGPLPTDADIEKMENEDYCAVCGCEGNLLCCDGCTKSYHTNCFAWPKSVSIPDGDWYCPECVLVDPAKAGPLDKGCLSALDWFEARDLDRNSHCNERNTTVSDPMTELSSSASHNKIDYSGEQTTQYLAIHGFVFKRPAPACRDHSPSWMFNPLVPMSGKEVQSLLEDVGLRKSRAWPLAQVPQESWLATGSPLRTPPRSFLKTREFYDPALYESRYRLAALPRPFSKVKDAHLSNYEDACCKINFMALSCRLGARMEDDKEIVTALQTDSTLFSPYPLIQDFILHLEASLAKSYLLDPRWGTTGTDARGRMDNWKTNVRSCRSIPRLCGFLLQLVDAMHPRAFKEDWFGNPTVKGEDHSVETDHSAAFQLASDSTPKEESRRRSWERCTAGNLTSLLSRESTNAGAWIRRLRPDIASISYTRKQRKKGRKEVSPEKPVEATVNSTVGAPVNLANSSRDDHQADEEKKDDALQDEGATGRRRSDRACSLGASNQSRIRMTENMGARIEIEQNARMTEMVKDLDFPPLENSPWPVAGRHLFDPAGRLPRKEVRRLARCAGTVQAAFVQYPLLHEVGQISYYHIWRKRVLNCDTLEEMLVLNRMLNSFINTPIVKASATHVRRANKAKTPVTSNIYCTQQDIKSGERFYFVLERGATRGRWRSWRDVDLESLAVHYSLQRAKRIQLFKNKFKGRKSTGASTYWADALKPPPPPPIPAQPKASVVKPLRAVGPKAKAKEPNKPQVIQQKVNTANATKQAAVQRNRAPGNLTLPQPQTSMLPQSLPFGISSTVEIIGQEIARIVQNHTNGFMSLRQRFGGSVPDLQVHALRLAHVWRAKNIFSCLGISFDDALFSKSLRDAERNVIEAEKKRVVASSLTSSLDPSSLEPRPIAPQHQPTVSAPNPAFGRASSRLPSPAVHFPPTSMPSNHVQNKSSISRPSISENSVLTHPSLVLGYSGPVPPPKPPLTSNGQGNYHDLNQSNLNSDISSRGSLLEQKVAHHGQAPSDVPVQRQQVPPTQSASTNAQHRCGPAPSSIPDAQQQSRRSQGQSVKSSSTLAEAASHSTTQDRRGTTAQQQSRHSQGQSVHYMVTQTYGSSRPVVEARPASTQGPASKVGAVNEVMYGKQGLFSTAPSPQVPLPAPIQHQQMYNPSSHAQHKQTRAHGGWTEASASQSRQPMVPQMHVPVGAQSSNSTNANHQSITQQQARELMPSHMEPRAFMDGQTVATVNSLGQAGGTVNPQIQNYPHGRPMDAAGTHGSISGGPAPLQTPQGHGQLFQSQKHEHMEPEPLQIQHIHHGGHSQMVPQLPLNMYPAPDSYHGDASTFQHQDNRNHPAQNIPAAVNGATVGHDASGMSIDTNGQCQTWTGQHQAYAAPGPYAASQHSGVGGGQPHPGPSPSTGYNQQSFEEPHESNLQDLMPLDAWRR